MTHRIGAVLWIACAAIAWAGCKKNPSPPPDAGAARAAAPSAAWLAGELPPSVRTGTPKRGGTLTVRIPAEPAMLNRLHDRGQDAWMVRTMFGSVVESLAELDRDSAPNYALKPLLAERWEISEDGLRTTFHLRKGVRFHNGEPFTSQDIRKLLEVVQDPKNATTVMRSHLAGLKRYETPDAHTLVLHWKQPYHLATRNFALTFPIFPASALEGELDALAINRAPIGTGPFRFESWETGKAITLARNDAYWGRAAYLDKVVFRYVKDHTIATQLFERGEFDLMTWIQPTVWRELEKPDEENAWAWTGYHRIQFREHTYSCIEWNQQRPFFADARVRRAVAHLIPMKDVAEGIYLGLEPPTTCPFYSLGPNCDPALESPDSKERIRYDPARAMALLDEAGWKDEDGDGLREKGGVPFRFRLTLFTHSPTAGMLAPVLERELAKAGIVVEIDRAEWAVMMDALRSRRFDAAVMGWSNIDVEDDLFANFHSTQIEGGNNYVGVADPKLDALLEESRRELSDTRRIELHRQLHRALYEDQVYTFLGVRSSLDAVKTRVRGVRPSVSWYRLADLWIE